MTDTSTNIDPQSRPQALAQANDRADAVPLSGRAGAEWAVCAASGEGQDVAAVAGCSDAELIEVVEVFRREDRCFLVPP